MNETKKGIIQLDKDISHYGNMYTINGQKYYIKRKKLIALLIESVASFVFHELNKKSILYRFASLNGKLVDISPNFTQNNDTVLFDTSMESLYISIINDQKYSKQERTTAKYAYSGNLLALKKIVVQHLNDNVYQDFINMFITDMFVLCDDRYAHNYSYTLDKQFKFAAIDAYDFDYSLGVDSGLFDEGILAFTDLFEGSNFNFFDEPDEFDDVNNTIRFTDHIEISKEVIQKVTANISAAVGLNSTLAINGKRLYPFYDLITYCIKEDNNAGNHDYQELIERQCDLLTPKIILDKYEEYIGLKLKDSIKNLLIYILEARKDDIWNELKEKNRQYKK